MIDNLTIDKIKEAANVKDVLDDFGYDLRKKGTKYLCLCPFHKDKSLGSFVVNPVKGTYACYSCGARGNAIDFLVHHEHMSYPDALRWLGKKYSIDVEGSDRLQVKVSPPRPPAPPKDMLILPRYLVVRSRENIDETNFIKWLKGLPWDEAQRARIDEVLKLYVVGRDKDGWSLFWQVDEHGQVLNGKLMKYLPNGHRDKGEEDIANGKRPFTTDWIHSRLKRKWKPEDPWPHPELFNPDIQEEHYTFFGMHLLNRYPKAVINIVESEKTAIVCAIAYGAMDMNLWMACGGKTWLSNERMATLFQQKRQIVLWPDTDGMDDWADWIKLMNQPSISIQRDFFTRYHRPEFDGQKADVADILIRWMTETKDGKPHQQHEPKAIADIIPEAVSQMVGNTLPGALEDGEPFFINTPLQQRMHDAVERNKKNLNNQPIIF